MTSPRLQLVAALLLGALCSPLSAWSPDAQLDLGVEAARMAPRDLWRQIARHERSYHEGLLAPFRARDPMLHQVNADGTGLLDQVIEQEVRRAISMIEGHQPFEQIVRQIGVVVHYSNDLHNPLNCSAADRSEGVYYADFLDYLDSSRPRIPVLFYGTERSLDSGQLGAFLQQVLARCREAYPLVGDEYRRIGKLPGSRYFDDRSTAFAVASLSYSRAISDAALLLRYIWIEAGGADFRSPPSSDEGRLLLIPRNAQ